MPRMMGKRKKEPEEKILDVNASMTGTMVFKDPVNLRINGKFEGTLSARGNLTIGQAAVVNGDIEGDVITVAGTVYGNIKANVKLCFVSPARVTGDIQTPVLSVEEGAILQGNCTMNNSPAADGRSSNFLGLEEVANYLEVKPSIIKEWASQGKIPARKDDSGWMFDKAIVDEWISKERVT